MAAAIERGRQGRRSRRRVLGLLVVAVAVVLTQGWPGAASHAADVPVSGTVQLSQARSVFNDAQYSFSGTAIVRFVGDVNGDGIPDEAIGAPRVGTSARPRAGRVSIVFGHRPQASTVDLTAVDGSTGVTVIGPNARARAGAAIAPLGDVNGDGYDDVLVGAPRASTPGHGTSNGAAYVILGAASGSTIDLGHPSSRVIAIQGPNQGDHAGAAVGSVPDLDGDGRPEALVGAPADAEGALPRSAAFVVFSHSLDKDVDLAVPGGRGFRMIYGGGGDAGAAVDGVPDITGDGVPDVLVGAPELDKTFVVAGRTSHDDTDLLNTPAFSGYNNDGAGASLAALGDTDGDGIPEIAIGAPDASPAARAGAGRVYVISGRTPPGPLAQLGDGDGVHRIDGAAAGDQVGSSLAALGDVDGDGRADVAVGAPGANPFGRPAGGAYVVYGGAGDVDLALAGRAALRLTGGGDLRGAGSSLDGGADVDRDGRPDLLVGSEGYGSLLGIPQRALAPSAAPALTRPCSGPAGNVALIVGDSASMRAVDPQNLRVAAIDGFLAKARPQRIVVSAVKFGNRVSQVFPPVLTGTADFEGQLPLLQALVHEHLGRDIGGRAITDALSGARRQDPGRDAQILITDGVNTVGPAPTAATADVPTYVIGLGIAAGSLAAEQLGQLANATGGRFYAGVRPVDLQAVLDTVEAALACESPVDVMGVGPFGSVNVQPGATATFRSSQLVPPDARRTRLISLTLTTRWRDPDAPLSVVSVNVLRGRRVRLHVPAAALRRAANQVRALTVHGVRVSVRSGPTFVAVTLSGLKAVRTTAHRRAMTSTTDADSASWTVLGGASQKSKPKKSKKKAKKRKATKAVPSASARWDAA